MLLCAARYRQSALETLPFLLVAGLAEPQPLGLLSKAAHVDAPATEIIRQSLCRTMPYKPEKRGPT